MAQLDYVRRHQSAPARRKKSNSKKKQRSTPAVSLAMVAITAAVLIAFIGGLYFITHHKKEEFESLQNQKVTANGLPAKPEERWRYIKELESRQLGVREPTEPTAGGEMQKPEQLTDEQRQLLAQMQADLRQTSTQLNEVPWNEQTTEQRQVQQIQHQPQSTQNQSVQQPARIATPPHQMQQQQKPASNTQLYQDLLQMPPHSNAAQPKMQQAAPVTREAETAEKKDERRWLIQCGSFKGQEQAETVRAQLVFEGFDSRITSNHGWNRVVMGPLKGNESADVTLGKLKLAGHANCIRLSAEG